MKLEIRELGFERTGDRDIVLELGDKKVELRCFFV